MPKHILQGSGGCAYPGDGSQVWDPGWGEGILSTADPLVRFCFVCVSSAAESTLKTKDKTAQACSGEHQLEASLGAAEHLLAPPQTPPSTCLCASILKASSV